MPDDYPDPDIRALVEMLDRANRRLQLVMDQIYYAKADLEHASASIGIDPIHASVLIDRARQRLADLEAPDDDAGASAVPDKED